MKRYLPLAALSLLMMLRCSGTGTGDTDTGFTYQPGSLTALSVNANKSFSVSIDGESCAASSSCYAIISTFSINSINYVGIAISDNPDVNNSFNMRIRFVSSGIPTSITLDHGNSDHMIKVRRNTQTSFNAWSSGNITLSFTDNLDGTYTINYTGGSAIIDGQTLNNLTIRAQKYP